MGLEAGNAKSTAVAPAARGTRSPLWESFLERIFRHDPELVGFVQRVLGYALVGELTEQVLLFCWGQGGNGKSVLLNTASRLLGDYACIAPPDLLLSSQSDRHPCDLAMLRGARFVTASELAQGRAWDEPKLKSLTGGDPITARFMRQDFFTYQPQFTLLVAGNHKPSFRGVDEAIRRRVWVIISALFVSGVILDAGSMAWGERHPVVVFVAEFLRLTTIGSSLVLGVWAGVVAAKKTARDWLGLVVGIAVALAASEISYDLVLKIPVIGRQMHINALRD